MEIAFRVDAGALKKISPQMQEDEASILNSFDQNRPQIEYVAGTAYSRKRKSYHLLSASDF